MSGKILFGGVRVRLKAWMLRAYHVIGHYAVTIWSCMITYHVNEPVTTEEFITVLRASTLAERRPVEDAATMEAMLRHANLIVAARDEGKLVGVARSLTDFSYIAYLSDLAVDTAYQRQGIGKELIRRTQRELGQRCKLLLLAAPAAVDYYPKLGFEHHPQAWILPREREIS